MSDIVIIAIVNALASIVTVFLTLIIKRHLGQVHKQINSRMDELVEVTKSASKAEGKLEEKSEAEERQKNL